MRKTRNWIMAGFALACLTSVVLLALLMQPNVNDVGALAYQGLGILILAVLAFLFYSVKRAIKKAKQKTKLESQKIYTAEGADNRIDNSLSETEPEPEEEHPKTGTGGRTRLDEYDY